MSVEFAVIVNFILVETTRSNELHELVWVSVHTSNRANVTRSLAAAWPLQALTLSAAATVQTLQQPPNTPSQNVWQDDDFSVFILTLIPIINSHKKVKNTSCELFCEKGCLEMLHDSNS